MVRFLKHTEINREKWDRSIAGAVFETIYAYSWYLDLVNPGWDALVAGDYEMIMPLTTSRRMGFHLLLQPILAQQLGIFSSSVPGAPEIQEFVKASRSRFRYIDVCLNTQNGAFPKTSADVERANYELNLEYENPGYTTNIRRNLAKGKEFAFEFKEITLSDYLNLKYSPGEKIMVGREYLDNLFSGLLGLERAKVFGIYLGDELEAAAVLGYAETRVIYMNGCSSESGKDNRAMFVLMDSLIIHSRGKAAIFDFEGSEIPGVARFFEGFGGKKTLYTRIVRKKFPFTLMPR